LENHEKLKILTGILLIISSITHVLQIFIVGFEWHDIFAAIYGASYSVIGILLIKYLENKLITFIGIVFPAVGGVMGLFRLFVIELALQGNINYFIIFHVIVDIIVVPICIYSFCQIRA